MRKLFLFLLFSSFFVFAQAQQFTSDNLIGYWEGAFIKVNSYQKFEISIAQRQGKLYGLQIMDEWHPTFGEFEVPVKIDSTGVISFGTGYGQAKMKLDPNNLEMVGALENQQPTINIHLKKIADPPKPNYEVEEVSVKNNDISLYGHLHLPKGKIKTAVIFVAGRGCNADLTKYNLYAKFLRKYGVAMLVYHKRGTGKSTGDCNTATIDDLASDLKAAKEYLKSRSENFEKIGTLGVSAGGWTMAKASEITDLDFMISVVGPSQSVKQQQIASSKAGADVYGLTVEAKNELLEYLYLMFEAKSNQKGFEEMQVMLEKAKANKWFALLEDTDVPENAAAIKNLWVLRNDYDPKKALRGFKKPFLGIYGERDWIVPAQDQIDLLDDYFSGNPDNLKTVIAYDAEHGMEMQSRWVEIDANTKYYHFYRISPQVRIEIVDFMREHDLMP